MEYVKSAKYDKQFVTENMMGPNCLKMIEELTFMLDIRPGMRVLDLGCGRGLTSIFLAKEFGATVYATDLWIGATENLARFEAMGLSDLIIPIHADATDLPFAHEYFDAVISVDAYHYFGREALFMDTKLAPFVKPRGQIALAFPGFKKDIRGDLPSELLISWTAKDLETFSSREWWEKLLTQSEQIRVQSVKEMTCFDECWKDWLASDNDYALSDRGSMEAGAGRYMNFISVLARKADKG